MTAPSFRVTLTFTPDLPAWAADFGLTLDEAAEDFAEHLRVNAHLIPETLTKHWATMRENATVEASDPIDTSTTPGELLVAIDEAIAAYTPDGSAQEDRVRWLLEQRYNDRANTRAVKVITSALASVDHAGRTPVAVLVGTFGWENGHFFSENDATIVYDSGEKEDLYTMMEAEVAARHEEALNGASSALGQVESDDILVYDVATATVSTNMLHHQIKDKYGVKI